MARKYWFKVAIVLGVLTAPLAWPGLVSADPGGEGLLGDGGDATAALEGDLSSEVGEIADTSSTGLEPMASDTGAEGSGDGSVGELDPHVVEDVKGALEPVSSQVGESVSPAVESAGKPLSILTEEPLEEEPLEAVEPAIDAVDKALEPLGPVLQPVLETAEALVGTAAETLEPVTEPVTDVIKLPERIAETPVETPSLLVEDPAFGSLPPGQLHAPSIATEPVTAVAPPATTVSQAGVLPEGMSLADSGAGTVVASAEMPRQGDEDPGTATSGFQSERANRPSVPVLGSAGPSIDQVRPGDPGFMTPTGIPALGASTTVDRVEARPHPARSLAVAQPSAGAGGPSSDWPSAALSAVLLGLLASGVLALIAASGVQPRSWQFRPYTPPA